MSPADAAWLTIEVRMTELRQKQAWLDEAVISYGRDVITPAPGYAAAVQALEVSRARARGAAEVMAIFLGTTADEIAREAARRFARAVTREA